MYRWMNNGIDSILNNLPLGIQLAGDKHDDLRFLGVANWLEKSCKKYAK